MMGETQWRRTEPEIFAINVLVFLINDLKKIVREKLGQEGKDPRTDESHKRNRAPARSREHAKVFQA